MSNRDGTVEVIINRALYGMASPVGVIGGLILVVIFAMVGSEAAPLLGLYFFIVVVFGGNRRDSGRDPYDVDPSDPYDSDR